MKKRRNLAGKKTWAAKYIYIYMYIYSKMSYDNFRNGFWNPSTFGSDSQQRYSFYLKKVVI